MPNDIEIEIVNLKWLIAKARTQVERGQWESLKQTIDEIQSKEDAIIIYRLRHSPNRSTQTIEVGGGV